MSQRTIVEINHDLAHAIERNPDDFMMTLRMYLGSGDPRHAERLRLSYGFNVAWRGHHSDERSVVTKYSTVKL